MWGMPITVAIVELASPSPLFPAELERGTEIFGDLLQAEPYQASERAMNSIAAVFAYFKYIDDKFSTYKPNSEISRINQGALALENASREMHTVFDLAEKLRRETSGYFNIRQNGRVDPSGLVKGWALSNAAGMLSSAGYKDFYVEAGGDFQAVGLNPDSRPWRVGVRSPFNREEIVKVLTVSDRGVATSGTYVRGQHIYDPVTGKSTDPAILSITVVGPDVYQADCYATAAFAMGRAGIQFIESLEGFEGFMIDHEKQATFTSGFNGYVSRENHR
jgi:thiamine biosynthesis lipoprotein